MGRNLSGERTRTRSTSRAGRSHVRAGLDTHPVKEATSSASFFSLDDFLSFGRRVWLVHLYHASLRPNVFYSMTLTQWHMHI